ncbi:MAG: putative serine/threonine protein kinase [Phycisphaerales bacterium]|nr:putative serine/threonine protein kinase [Phycisphaerales bacterium]
MSSLPPPPKTLFGYDVVERLGEGAHSAIYVVSARKTGQLYALKHVVPTEPKHVRFIEQIQTEFAVSRTFRHPGLRKCIALTLRKKYWLFGPVTEAAMVMELVDGVPLDVDLPAELPAVVDVFVKVAAALGALHHYRYLHCDTKPNNILRDRHGAVRVIDFGQACLAGTRKERIQGTPDFIAPEQALCQTLEYPTDVYNFGATLYWALTGGQRVPTMMNVSKDERQVVRDQKYPAPADLNPKVPPALSKLVMECLKVAPAYRPQSMDEIIQRLTPYGTGGAAKR